MVLSRESRRSSLVEALANVALGYGVAMSSQASVLSLFGLHAGVAEHAAIAGIFTAVSIVRSYALRRVFNRASRLKLVR